MRLSCVCVCFNDVWWAYVVYVWCEHLSVLVCMPLCVYAKPRARYPVSSSITLHLVTMRQGLSMNWKLAISVSLARHWTFRIHLSLTLTFWDSACHCPQCWSTGRNSYEQFFMWMLGIWTQTLILAVQTLFYWIISPDKVMSVWETFHIQTTTV